MKASASQITLQVQRKSLKPGLYLVATPIGNLGDMSLRALSTLISADIIYCEDTRVSLKLLRHFGFQTPLEAYHEHNAAHKRPEILQAIDSGKVVALISDAGTPLISDPGYKLVREAIDHGLHVEAVPGASSVMHALCVAGLPTDRFLFLGFAHERKALVEVTHVRATLILFESAGRLADTLALAREVLGDREAAVARELTKLYEEVRRGPLSELEAHYAEHPTKGEIVLLVAPGEALVATPEELDDALRAAMNTHSLKEASALVAAKLGLPKNKVYARALELKAE